ncbi:MAG: histidine kinase [Bacteroidales bacterium]
MKKKIKITETLILYFVIIGFISIASVSVLTYYQYRKAILERSFEQLTSIRNLKKQKTEVFFKDRLRDVEVISRSVEVKNITLKQKNDELTGLTVESYMYSYIFASPYYRGLVFAADSHAVYQYSDSLYPMPYLWLKDQRNQRMKQLSESNNAPFLMDYSTYRSDSLNMTVGAGVYDPSGNYLGFIALDIPLAAIDEIMLESISNDGFGESGESYLVGSDNLMRSSSRFIPQSVLNVNVETEATKKAFAQGEGTIVTKDYRGVDVLSSFCRLSVPGIDLILLSEIDLREVLTPVTRLRNQLLLLSVILIIGVFLVGWLLAATIASPIIRIKEAAIKVSQGAFPIIGIDSNNEEINELVHAFDDMSAQLKEKKEQLQAEQLKQLSAMFDGQESERKRLSYELHDGLGQSLVALKYRIESFSKNSTHPFQEELKELEQSVAETIEEVRQMSFNLMPAILNEFGLVPAIQNMCGKLTLQTGCNIIFESDGNFNTLNEKQINYIYRIAQEILSNAIKHAEASLISLQLIEFSDFFTLIGEDDGKGFRYDPAVPLEGNGLYSIKERTEILQGKLIIQSELNRGTIIRIKIPKQETERPA